MICIVTESLSVALEAERDVPCVGQWAGGAMGGLESILDLT